MDRQEARELYEQQPMVRMQRGMRLHREVILTRQTDLMPLAMAGDTRAQREIEGLSELARSFTASVRGVFGSAMDRELEERWRHAVERAGRSSTAPPSAA